MPTQLSSEQVLKIARLARLGLSEVEAQKFGMQLSGLLDYAAMLNEVDTQGVEPIAQITGLSDVFSDDEAQPFSNAKALLGQSPQPVQQNMIRVPKTL